MTVGGRHVDPKVTISVVSVAGLLVLTLVVIFARWLCIRKRGGKVSADETKRFNNVTHEVIHDEDF